MHRRRIVIAGSWAALVALLLPAIFGGKEDVWGRFIFEYQTLITGILAVFAAAIAVSQSVATDLAQEKRHRQQMFLSQRRELYATDRLVMDVVLRMGYVSARSNEFARYELPTASNCWSREARTLYLSLLRSTSRLYNVLEGIGELERGLFDARLAVAYAIYMRELGNLLQNFPDRENDFPDYYPMSDDAPATFDQGIRAQCIALAGQTEQFSREIKRWYEEIREIMVP